MKKKKLIEKRRALKEAYYNELKKTGVIEGEKTLEEYTVKELKEKQELTEENFNMTNEELKELIQTLGENESDLDNNEDGKPYTQDAGVQSNEELTEEQVQAVANAIVEQAEEDNKTIEDVVNKIVEEGKEEEQKPVVTE